MFVKIIDSLIQIYQMALSPFIGGSCRFHPTCSVYAREVLEKKPLLKGLALICKRLLKCHPWNAGGFDPVL